MKTKKNSLLALIVTLAFGTVQAQVSNKMADDMPKKNATEIAKKRADKLRKELELTDNQYEKLLVIQEGHLAQRRKRYEDFRTNKGESSERVEMIERLKKELDLSDVQMTQIRAISEKKETEMKALRAEMKQKKEAYRDELKGILDEKQWLKWEELKKNHRQAKYPKRG